ncbi:MAG: PKD domain-containing protein [Bacteroidota bacterium]|nr:PKD domain-containing protein [Bacteroidota bacterium]
MRKIIIILLGCIIISCNDKSKDLEPPIIADFSYEIDVLDYFKVHFTSFSENATGFSWDFGNGDSSNLENPTYTYASEGIYDVSLTVYGTNGIEYSKTREVILACGIPEDPLFGKQSKTWKLYRVGPAVTLGPDPSDPDSWWEGFYNDGSRSCLYKHEFIFNKDRTFEFVDHNVFWGDQSIWPPEDPVYESCFEPSSNNMVVNNTDLSVWLSGVHNFEFFSSNGIILKGEGAWIGFPFLGTSSNHGINLPDSVAFSVSFEQMSSFDLMTVNFDHGENGFWTFRYVSYDDWQDEPPLIE